MDGHPAWEIGSSSITNRTSRSLGFMTVRGKIHNRRNILESRNQTKTSVVNLLSILYENPPIPPLVKGGWGDFHASLWQQAMGVIVNLFDSNAHYPYSETRKVN